ncbi:hypothetical protein EDD21DRAFT_354836 [Dissophora ornata]|nr:hypothetical protein BGZ58_006226 [Dissophora ornata]KAI8600127.1 hypothetical protein EDD21DRAFT_354836 [Dissophora ornata]
MDIADAIARRKAQFASAHAEDAGTTPLNDLKPKFGSSGLTVCGRMVEILEQPFQFTEGPPEWAISFIIRDFQARVERKVVILASESYQLPKFNECDEIVIKNASFIDIPGYGETIFAETLEGDSWTIYPWNGN